MYLIHDNQNPVGIFENIRGAKEELSVIRFGKQLVFLLLDHRELLLDGKQGVREP